MVNNLIHAKDIIVNEWNCIGLSGVSADKSPCEGIWAQNRFNVMYGRKFITSADGVSWNITGTSDREILSKKVTFYADTLDKYIVYYPDDDRGYLSISSDAGESWTTETKDFTVKRICKSPKGRYFLATNLGVKVTDDFVSFTTIPNTQEVDFIYIASSPSGMMAASPKSLYYCTQTEDEWIKIDTDDIFYDIASIGYINNLYIIGTVGSKLYNCSTYNPQLLHEVNTPLSFFDKCFYDGTLLYFYHEAPRSYLTTSDGYRFIPHEQKSEVNGTLMGNDTTLVVIGQGSDNSVGYFVKDDPISIGVGGTGATSVIEARHNLEIRNNSDRKVQFMETIGQNWKNEPTGGFSQIINIDGILEEDSPIIDVLLDDDTEVSKTQIKAWSNISRITTGKGLIKVYCYKDKPNIDINIQIICVR